MLDTQSCPTHLLTHGLYPSRLLCPWDFLGKNNWSGLPFPTPGDRPNPGIEPGSPILQADSLLSEPPGKPYNFPYVNAMFSETLNHTNIVSYLPKEETLP